MIYITIYVKSELGNTNIEENIRVYYASHIVTPVGGDEQVIKSFTEPICI